MQPQINKAQPRLDRLDLPVFDIDRRRAAEDAEDHSHAAVGLVALLDSDVTTPVNIGSMAEMTILELASTVIELTDSSSELAFEALPVDDPVQRRPDITVARERLGWEPRVDVRDGLQRTIEYFRGVIEASGG